MRKSHIHIEGMGILGCLMALELESRGIRFTWSDTEQPFNAWRACTGAIYPAGLPLGYDMRGYTMWWRKFKQENFKDFWPTRCFESANFMFNHKSGPPHRGHIGYVPTTDKNLGTLLLPSFHLNAQRFVPWVRAFSAKHREDSEPKSTTYLIRAHPHAPLHEWNFWGWTVPVQVKYKGQNHGDKTLRNAYYIREGRFVMTYAYPIPGENWWYAGSAIYKQAIDRAKELEIMPKLTRWIYNFQRLSGGMLKVVGHDLDTAMQGWRPAGRSQEPITKVTHRKRGAVMHFPTLWNSGVRHGPLVINDALHNLNLGGWTK